MSEEPTEYRKQEQWRKDFWHFVSNLRKHWVAFVTGGSAMAIITLLVGLGVKIPHVVYYMIPICSGIVVAAFQVFRGQARHIEAKESELESLRASNERESRDKERQRHIVAELSKFHEQLTSRCRNIYEQGDLQFFRENEKEFQEERMDQTSSDLVRTVERFLRESVDDGAAAIFKDTTKCEPIRPDTHSFVGPRASKHHLYWQNMRRLLEHHATNLLSVIEAQRSKL